MLEKVILRAPFKILAVCCLLLILSCKARKQLTDARRPVADTAVITKKTDLKSSKLDAIRAAQTTFVTFSGKASTQLAINGNSNNVTLNVRIKANEKIWVSVTAFAGIEVARALITPDNLLLVNRLDNVYLKKPFGYIKSLAVKQVNYKMLESLLVGNAIPELVNEGAVLQNSADTTILSGTLDSVVYKLKLGPAMKVLQTNLSNENERQSLQVLNSVFVQVVNNLTPSQIEIKSIVKDKKIQVTLHYIKIAFDQPLEFPFSIPASYTETN